MCCTKIFFRQKLLQITICNFWCKNFFDRPTGLASALIAQFVFFCVKCFKSALYKNFFQTKVVTHQKSQLLSYVTFFDILRHFGVIAASQICSVSVSRKYCAVLGNRFLIFSTIQSIEKALHWFKKMTSRFWWISTFWGLLSPKKSFLACRLCVCLCLCVCLSVDNTAQKIIELAQPNLVWDIIW